MPFYPNTHLILPMTTIRRERKLPEGVNGLDAPVREDAKVDPDTVVLRGARAGDYRIIPLRKPLGVRRGEPLENAWIKVGVNDQLEMGRVLAERGPGRRAPRVVAPDSCIIRRIDLDQDQMIIQIDPEEVDVRATFPGTVTNVTGKSSVQIESIGALIQAAWGNGKMAFGAYREEPEGGIQALADESLVTSLRGQIILLKRPLTRQALEIARVQEVGGLIAPGMPSDLRAMALNLRMAIVLTEGFGAEQMSQIVYNLLRDNLGRTIALDAVEPSRWSSDRPELFVQLPSGGSLPAAPERDQFLTVNTAVRLARAPYRGLNGTVKRLVETPRAVDSGLRLTGAEIQLSDGRIVFAPIANIELLGRAPGSR
jgi:hypothetical protein